MYNTGKVLTGIGVFLVVALLPFWYNPFSGRAGSVPDLERPAEAKQCVEETRYMRLHHMDLLAAWKEKVVREGRRQYAGKDGKAYTMSLTGTCMQCHASKARFCDRCHDYGGVRPQCWECHLHEDTVTTAAQKD
jgi:hypothetical protein